MKAIIFDFNGVIIDDEPLHLELLREVLIEEGMTFAQNDYHEKYLGIDDRRCFERALVDHDRAGEARDQQTIDRLIARKTSRYREAVGERDLLFPGMAELLRELGASYPLGLVSGALRGEIEAALAPGNLHELFRCIISSEDVTRSKPDPEGYLRALAILKTEITDLAASDCLVVEDSRAGVEAAGRAGMRCLAVTTSFPPGQLTHADWVAARATDWFRAPGSPALSDRRDDGRRW